MKIGKSGECGEELSGDISKKASSWDLEKEKAFCSFWEICNCKCSEAGVSLIGSHRRKDQGDVWRKGADREFGGHALFAIWWPGERRRKNAKQFICDWHQPLLPGQVFRADSNGVLGLAGLMLRHWEITEVLVNMQSLIRKAWDRAYYSTFQWTLGSRWWCS